MPKLRPCAPLSSLGNVPQTGCRRIHRERFKARITAVDTTKMDRSYLGEAITPKLIEKLEQDNVDVCGENGEYHTIVTDGPIFKKASRDNLRFRGI